MFIIQNSRYMQKCEGRPALNGVASDDNGPFGFPSREAAERFAADNHLIEVEIERTSEPQLTSPCPEGY